MDDNAGGVFVGRCVANNFPNSYSPETICRSKANERITTELSRRNNGILTGKLKQHTSSPVAGDGRLALPSCFFMIPQIV